MSSTLGRGLRHDAYADAPPYAPDQCVQQADWITGASTNPRHEYSIEDADRVTDWRRARATVVFQLRDRGDDSEKTSE
jgi:hypothetical protein